MTSSATLPSEPVIKPSRFTTSAKPSRANVPGRDRHAETELLAERLLDLQAFVAERGERAGRAGELANEDPGLELLQTLGMAVEHRQPDRGFVAERDRQSLLQVGAPSHERIAVLFGEISEDPAQVGNLLLDDLEPSTDP
jgi:hypothetical protein